MDFENDNFIWSEENTTLDEHAHEETGIICD